MKMLLPIMLLAISTLKASAQKGVVDGIPSDSTTITLNINDSLKHRQGSVDTTDSGIWKIGTTSKPFFSPNVSNDYAIMTDTLKPYDTSTNSSFKVILNAYNFNTILSFRHKYQTRKGKDGGIVEYSLDTGKTWNNVLGDCNSDSLGLWQGILTSNFYKKNDTLENGEQAFSGTSNGWQYSRVQVFIGVPIKSTGTTKCVSRSEIQFRFRFYSDNEPDTLDGWMIDDLKIEQDDYGSRIGNLAGTLPIKIYPNPASDILNINMPQQYFNKLNIINMIGQEVYASDINELHQQINIKSLPAGTYTILMYGEYGVKSIMISKN